MRVGCRYRCITSIDKVSFRLTSRCRLNLSRVFRYQFCQQTTNNGIGIENNVPPNQTNRSSPGSFDRVIPQSGCAFGCLRRNRSGRPGTPAQRKERTSRVPLGGFWAPAAAVRNCRLVAECGLVHGWVFAVPVRMMWLLVFAKICCGNTCHPVIAISVVPKLVTTQAVWMPGLWRCPGTVWASGGLPMRRLTTHTWAID